MKKNILYWIACMTILLIYFSGCITSKKSNIKFVSTNDSTFIGVWYYKHRPTSCINTDECYGILYYYSKNNIIFEREYDYNENPKKLKKEIFFKKVANPAAWNSYGTRKMVMINEYVYLNNNFVRASDKMPYSNNSFEGKIYKYIFREISKNNGINSGILTIKKSTLGQTIDSSFYRFEADHWKFKHLF